MEVNLKKYAQRQKKNKKEYRRIVDFKINE